MTVSKKKKKKLYYIELNQQQDFIRDDCNRGQDYYDRIERSNSALLKQKPDKFLSTWVGY